MTRFFLVQHAARELVAGDPGLTAAGRAQAAELARGFRGLGAVYSGPLRRARETAAPIAAAAGLTVLIDDRLTERLNWTGGQRFFREWDRTVEDRDYVPPGGFSSRQAGDRLLSFLSDLAGTPYPIVAVTHGGVTADLLRTLLGDDAVPPTLLTDGLPACAITILEDLEVLEIAAS
jgi:broad specificity phosphatase PhoE